MSIYPDKDPKGNLTGRYKVEVQLKGRRIRGTFTSLQDAQAAEARFRHELVHPTVAVPLSPRSHDKRGAPKTLGQLYDKAAPSLWRGLATEVQSLQRAHSATMVIGASKLLGGLDPTDIDDLLDHLSDRSPATANRYLSALHTMLVWGKERGWVPQIPVFTWQTEKEGRIRWITEDEEAALYKALRESPVALAVKVAISTGMRRNELLHLSRTHVEPSWVRIWETKADLPRSVPISPDIHDTLVYLIEKDLMPTQAQLRYQWDTAKKAMGLANDPLFVFHACRHTCATRLVRANVNIRIIQRWLGHKRIETTLRYAHVNDTMLTNALSQLTHHDMSQMRSPRYPALLPETVLIPQSQSDGMVLKSLMSNSHIQAGVVKLADTQDLGSFELSTSTHNQNDQEADK